MRGERKDYPEALLLLEVARDFRITPTEVGNLDWWVVQDWVAYKQARAERFVERVNELFKPTEEPKQEYHAEVETRDRLRRDYERWAGKDEMMAATLKRGLDAAEKKIAELAPKADPFVVAIGLLRLIAEERGL